MQCTVCHNEVPPQGAFCPSCGAPIPTPAAAVPGFTETYAPPPPPNYPTPGYPPPAGYPPPTGTASGLSNNAAAAIAYLTVIPAIIFLVLEPYNRVPLIRFHAWQSIALTVAAIVLQAMLSILSLGLHFIPGIFILFSLLHFALGLGLFCIWIFVILKASKGEWFKLPIIGDFADKQARTQL